MPVYVYQCPCGHTAELTHSIYDEQSPLCPECDGCTMIRKPSVGGVAFVGNGWGKDNV